MEITVHFLEWVMPIMQGLLNVIFTWLAFWHITCEYWAGWQNFLFSNLCNATSLSSFVIPLTCANYFARTALENLNFCSYSPQSTLLEVKVRLAAESWFFLFHFANFCEHSDSRYLHWLLRIRNYWCCLHFQSSADDTPTSVIVS